MLKLLLERLTVLHAHLMLDGTGSAQFIALQHKYIMVGQDQLSRCCCISGDQRANPSRFNFSSSFSCLAATDMGLGQDSMPRVAFISGDNSVGGTGYADTTNATGTPFLRKM